MGKLIPKNSVLFVVMFAILISGCDPVRSTHQTVKFKITDSDGKPVSDIRVELKAIFNIDSPSNDLENLRRELWENLPWESTLSNDSGAATVNIVTTMLNRSSGKVPKSDYNIIGRRYQFRLDSGDSQEIEIQEGMSISLDGVSVAIIEISKPKYIQTKN